MAVERSHQPPLRVVTMTATTLRRRQMRLAVVSIAAAVVTIGLKALAWRVTGSAGFLSDAAQSLLGLLAAILALATIRRATGPSGEHHTRGHGIEGTLTLAASFGIAWVAVVRLIHPVPLEDVRAGIAVFLVASMVNILVALLLLREGHTLGSFTLEGDGLRLLTGVCTSEAVIAGVAVVAITGWERVDPLIALIVATHLLVAGVRRNRRDGSELLDRASAATAAHRARA